jgi:3-hydroxybutyryl-CoA dehydratase
MLRLPLSEKSIDQIAVGDHASFSRVMEAAVVDAYADLILDHSPLHVDDEYARTTPMGRRVVHGMLLSSHFSSIVGMLLPGRRALLSEVTSTYASPVFVGDRVTFSARVDQIDVQRATIRLTTLVLRGSKVCSHGEALVEVRQ